MEKTPLPPGYSRVTAAGKFSLLLAFEFFKITSMKRNVTKKVTVGSVEIGGNAPVTVQSMTNTKTTDIDATVRQIDRLVRVGCDIVRLAVPDFESADAFAVIKKKVTVPLVADIQFHHKLAIASIEAGADKIRINPGNIGGQDKLQAVIKSANAAGIPIRIGVNSGSIEKKVLVEEGGATVRALIKSALSSIATCRDLGAKDLVLSVKSSNVLRTIAAYRQVSKKSDIPLHLGVTEAGTPRTGTIRSAVAMGVLLEAGIGDTIRVSLTGDPVEEVLAGLQILKSLERRPPGVTLISCPTCGRTEVDMIPIANEIEAQTASLDKNIRIAVMGCVVNGPGEAREADIGVACGKNSAVLFKKGEIISKIAEDQIIKVLVDEARNWDPDKNQGLS